MAELTILDRIKALRDELRERRVEVTHLDAQALQLAGTDAEASISTDQRARAIERYIGNRELALVDLIEQRHAEQLAERDTAIDALLLAKLREVDETTAVLTKATDVFFQAAGELLKISLPGANVPPGLSGVQLLEPYGFVAPSSIREAERIGRSITRAGLMKTISDSRYVAREQLGRAAGLLKQAGRNADLFPVNPADAIAFAQLRSLLPAFRLDSFDEPEPVDLEAEFVADREH